MKNAASYFISIFIVRASLPIPNFEFLILDYI